MYRQHFFINTCSYLVKYGFNKELQMNFNTLATFGCSFTYGGGSKNPETDSWGAQLSEKMNIKHVNYGEGGSSNDRIVRKLIHHDTDLNDNMLVVIMFSFIERSEIFYKNEYYHIGPWFLERKDTDRTHMHLVKNFYRNFSHQNQCFNLHKNMLMAELYLKSKNIPYVFCFIDTPYIFDGFDQGFGALINRKYVMRRFSKTYEEICAAYPNDFDPEKFDHTGKAGYKLMADELYDFIRDTHAIKE